MNEQAVLRLARDAILRNRFTGPAMPLSPGLARRLADFRADIDAEVYVMAIAEDRVTVLVAPRHDLDLFVLVLADGATP